MKTIAFYDTKPYDKVWFNKLKDKFGFEIKYFEEKLNKNTAIMSQGCDGVVAFVNDLIDKETIEKLHNNSIDIIAMRCAGYNNVDFKAAFKKVHIVTVPAYSPYAVAEHTAALLLTLVRKTHRAYNRTREGNFNINGLTGFDLYGKTVGIIGTGKIGKVFIDICKGFGMNVLAYDLYPQKNSNIKYVTLEELYKDSDIISLHCPLTESTRHIIDKKAFDLIKSSAIIINTSRGALIDSEALLDALVNEKIAGAALDVYEEEDKVFFEDFSGTIIKDEVLARLVTLPNVIVTSHQAFLTNEALEKIANITLENLKSYFNNEFMENEICYKCLENKKSCHFYKTKQRCF